ncbi:hypothetical protein PGO_123080 [Plasmodium gonderi]|uniref:Uncharacterized protein n=1 Tax=Plasmodium gonderi TaxID=77519 RepID=A0A1Y1JJA0_PLAGO|nr:hypothetical protein PGO_123080 [Plasmodium gonderi]GAW82310.1 hypothetical protein PGO_123080 [Plasmodium gonderi]
MRNGLSQGMDEKKEDCLHNGIGKKCGGDEAVEDEALEDEAVEDEAVEDEEVQDEEVEDEAAEQRAIEEDLWSNTQDEGSGEKKTLRTKIRELESAIKGKIVKLQKELKESKENEKIHEFDFADILNEFKDEITKRINEVSQIIEKKIEEQNLKHTKLFNMLISLKNENSKINKSLTILNDKIHVIQGEIGD